MFRHVFVIIYKMGFIFLFQAVEIEKMIFRDMDSAYKNHLFARARLVGGTCM